MLQVALTLLAVQASALGQSRVDTLSERVVTMANGGTIAFIKESKGQPYFAVRNDDDYFQCRFTMTTKGFMRRYWGVFADYLDNVVVELESHPNSDWGYAWNRIGASAAVGFCDLSLSTKEGTAYLYITHNRACFGSAGCNKDSALFRVSAENVNELATALKEESP